MSRTICPETQKLTALVSDQVDPGSLEHIVAHIDTCPDCMARLVELNNNLFSKLEETPVTLAPDKRFTASVPASSLPDRFKLTPAVDRHNRIGHFQIIRKLGEGGMGQVYECLDTKLNRHVAVKWIKAAILSPALLERLEQEARIHARLNHPNIVSLLEFGIAEGMPYLVMELVEGGTLRNLLKEQKLGVRESAGLVMEVARCVQAAHEQGVLHRDLKPANILLQPRAYSFGQNSLSEHQTRLWTPKVTDFGLAASIDSLISTKDTIETLQGTPFYMAPEQLSGSSRNVGSASDIYAIGVILYELLAGRVPFAGQELVEVRDMVLQQQPIPPRTIQAGVPLDLETICLKCLEKEPRLRYSSAGELADDLECFLQRRPILARPLGPVGKAWRWARRNTTVAALLGFSFILITLIIAGSVFYALNQNKLRQRAEDLKLIAQMNEQIANNQFEQIRDKYFRELELSSNGFDELRKIYDQGFAQLEFKTYYYKMIEQRFERANEMIQRADLLQVESEHMVEAFYLVALQKQAIDQNLAMPMFQAAVDRAKRIAEKRKLNPLGRFCAINADNYLGVFQDQRQNPTESEKFYQDGWDHFRLSPSEDLDDPRLRKFTLLIGRNLASALKANKKTEKAETVIRECEEIERPHN